MGWLNDSWNRLTRKAKRKFRRKAKKNLPQHRSRGLKIEPSQSGNSLRSISRQLPHQIVGTQDAGFTAACAWARRPTATSTPTKARSPTTPAPTAAMAMRPRSISPTSIPPSPTSASSPSCRREQAQDVPAWSARGTTAISTLLLDYDGPRRTPWGGGMAWQSIGSSKPVSGTWTSLWATRPTAMSLPTRSAWPRSLPRPPLPTKCCFRTGDAAYSESPNSNWQSYADPSAYNGDFRHRHSRVRGEHRHLDLRRR